MSTDTATKIRIDAFGDPACPWDFSAEGSRLRIAWRYGEHLRWHHRMVGLSLTRNDYADRGITLEDLSTSRENIARHLGMPIDALIATRHIATAVACRAVIAVRRFQPNLVDAFLRHLRVLGLSRRLYIDETETLREAARLAGISSEDLTRWSEDPEVDEELALDMADARQPLPAARVMHERLAETPDGGVRYTCPTYLFSRDGMTLVAPGFQPARVYEALLANLAPDITPRGLPTDVIEVLEWAPYPLATVEIATMMEAEIDVVREALQTSGASFEEVARDGYWSLHGAGSPTT